MNLNEYQKKAMSFRMDTATSLYAILNLGGEVGELYSLLAKATRDGAKEDFDEQLKKELGDILWHVAAVAIDYGFTLDDVAETNINKLSSRKARNVITGSGDNR
jgi:NTP pyrophosphatase (non-canonical NTP hydrolase)